MTKQNITLSLLPSQTLSPLPPSPARPHLRLPLLNQGPSSSLAAAAFWQSLAPPDEPFWHPHPVQFVCLNLSEPTLALCASLNTHSINMVIL
jgi:hypothetical protein